MSDLYRLTLAFLGRFPMMHVVTKAMHIIVLFRFTEND